MVSVAVAGCGLSVVGTAIAAKGVSTVFVVASSVMVEAPPRQVVVAEPTKPQCEVALPTHPLKPFVKPVVAKAKATPARPARAPVPEPTPAPPIDPPSPWGDAVASLDVAKPSVHELELFEGRKGLFGKRRKRRRNRR